MIVYRELSSLERDLGVSAKTLYALSNRVDRHYRTVRVPKRDGGERVLSVPDGLLALVQRRINACLLQPMPVSPYATAYRLGCSVRQNAAPHVGREQVLTLDIYRFFDSVSYRSVKDAAFPPEIYAEPLRVLLTLLCYHREALPQGAPTSPAISNLLLRDFDEEVGAFCKARGVRYTRYCDDLTFSGSFDPAEVTAFVRQSLKKRGYLLNQQKTKLRRRGQGQRVTGVGVETKTAVPAVYRRALRQEVYYIGKFGLSDHLRRRGLDTLPEQYLCQLLGKVNYTLQIDPTNREMQTLRETLKQMQKETHG